MAIEEKTPVLVPAATITVAAHRVYENERASGILGLNETLYICVKKYSDKGAEEILLEKKMTNDKDLKDMDCGFVAKVNFMDQGKIAATEELKP